MGSRIQGQLILILFLSASAAAAIDKCESCSRIAEAFQRGLERTAKDNFGGGNTHWEESRLGSYALSETRLVDITERLCADESKEDGLVCHSLLENLEETIESWWSKQFRDNYKTAIGELRDFLCVKQIGQCCPYNTFGQQCSPCPSSSPAGQYCSGRGTCDGNGTKSGTGSCECELGYTGSLCAECANGYYGNASQQQQPQCEQCDEACSKCTGASSANCTECAKGYEPQGGQQLGPLPTTCVDVDECLTQCNAEHEACTNTAGSFSCECKEGFHRVDGECKQKEEAAAADEAKKAEDQDDDSSEEEKEKGEEEKAGTAEASKDEL